MFFVKNGLYLPSPRGEIRFSAFGLEFFSSLESGMFSVKNGLYLPSPRGEIRFSAFGLEFFSSLESDFHGALQLQSTV